MLKHLLVGALTLSSLALAAPPVHGAVPIPAPRAPQAMPPPPPPRAPQANFGIDNDTRQASRLLRAFDEATARRDVRAIGNVERQFGAFLQQELREARMDRGGRAVLNRLNRIDSSLRRLQGRMNPQSLSAKRGLYAELVQLADGRPGRRF